MPQSPKWIANCLPERVSRIANASVYVLEVGPPQPNQLQTQEDLEAQGLVGLYRTAKKEKKQINQDQQAYLTSSDFDPSPSVLRGFLEPMGNPGARLPKLDQDLSRS